MDWHHEIIFVLSKKTYYIQNISVLLLAVLFYTVSRSEAMRKRSVLTQRNKPRNLGTVMWGKNVVEERCLYSSNSWSGIPFVILVIRCKACQISNPKMLMWSPNSSVINRPTYGQNPIPLARVTKHLFCALVVNCLLKFPKFRFRNTTFVNGFLYHFLIDGGSLPCQIWGSHGSDYAGCDAV